MYKYNKDNKVWEEFFDTTEIEINKLLIEKGFAPPYELFQWDKEKIYVLPTPLPLKPIKFVYVGDKNV